ncbi:MAG: ABC transporter ATP-binding protein [Halofilum sp. (in: g-proteobacteria)]|nr:ABC transporter ATP-binding protein [Halofilum sp. (in: g-proteobacteria)]
MARIGLDQLAHSYQANPVAPEDYALRHLDHVWEDGGAYALLGPSGCGKTTLLNIVSGLIVPTEGRVLFDDRDVTALPTEQRNIAQVFQFPVIYDTMTVFDNLAFPLRNRRVPDDHVERAGAARSPDMLDLERRCCDRKAAGLTADAKQKISLGRGLVRDDVDAIMFDEPLTVIDPHLKWQLRRKLKELHQKLGHDHDLRHPRPDRGADLRRQGGGDVRGPGGPARHAAGAVRAPGAHLRRLLHRLARHELPATANVDGGAAVVDGHRIDAAGDVLDAGRAAPGRLRDRRAPRVPAPRARRRGRPAACDVRATSRIVGSYQIVRADASGDRSRSAQDATRSEAGPAATDARLVLHRRRGR